MQARKLKSENGILAMPLPKSGRSLPDNVTERVREFYENEDYSRILPGKKDLSLLKLMANECKNKKDYC